MACTSRLYSCAALCTAALVGCSGWHPPSAHEQPAQCTPPGGTATATATATAAAAEPRRVGDVAMTLVEPLTDRADPSWACDEGRHGLACELWMRYRARPLAAAPAALRHAVAAAPNRLALLLMQRRLPYATASQPWHVVVVNPSARRVHMNALDKRVYLLQQARDRDGRFRDIEMLRPPMCGNSYITAALEPRHYWRIPMRRYADYGNPRAFATTMRVCLRVLAKPLRTAIYGHGGGEQLVCSRPYGGAIDPLQFRRPKHPYRPGTY